MDMRGQVRDGLLQRGFAPHVADAFILNFQDESGLNPGINEISPTVPGSRGGFGLYQLTGPRRVAYEQFAQQRGVQPADVDAQLDFMMQELQGPESRAAQNILSAPDTGSAAAAIVTDFLRPAEEHRNRRVAKYTGGEQQPAPQSAPRGILSTMNSEPEAPMEQEKIGGLLGMLAPSMDADRADELRLGFQGLLHNPNVGKMRAIEARMGGRAEGRERQQAAAQAQQQANRTAQWLAGQPGGEQFAQAIASGALPAGEALTMWRQQSQQGPTKGTEINGQLVNPTTGEVMGDYRDRGGSETEAEREIARLESIGMTREEAIRMKEGVIKVIPDPVTGRARLVDMQNNTSRILGDQQEATSAPQPEATGQKETQTEPEIGNVAGALGGRGVANSIANTVMDAVGGGLPAREAEQAASNLTSLSTQTMLALSGEWSGKPSNLTRERIEALTVKPNVLFTGPDKALIRFKEMSQLIGQSLISADEVSNGNYTPEQRTEAAQKKQTLAPLLQEYNAIIQQLEGGSGAGTGRTSGGVEWSVEP